MVSGRDAVPSGVTSSLDATTGRDRPRRRDSTSSRTSHASVCARAFDDVIDGVAMDLDTTRYQTFDELSQYCRRVASAVV